MKQLFRNLMAIGNTVGIIFSVQTNNIFSAMCFSFSMAFAIMGVINEMECV